jgi:hypothetical protein
MNYNNELSCREQRDQIRRCLELWCLPGHAYELRVIGAKRGTVAGFFDNLDALAAAIYLWSGKAKGVYLTLNPVNPLLLGRANNRVEEFVKGGFTSTDGDVLVRSRILIDADALTPVKGINSTDAEHAAALAVARDVREFLRGWDFPDPLYGSSGNGGHLLYGADLPNDEASRLLIEQFLGTLTEKFPTIDTVVHNAGRVNKVYGTLVMKGDSLPDRPHRHARILEAPAALQSVPVELLKAVAALRVTVPLNTKTLTTASPAAEPDQRAELTVESIGADVDAALAVTPAPEPGEYEGAPRTLDDTVEMFVRRVRRHYGDEKAAGLRKGKWLCRCPAHDDSRASLSMEKTDQKLLLKCFAGCEFSKIVNAVNMKDYWFFKGVTVEELAEAKKLPVEFLNRLSVVNGSRCVQMPYFTHDNGLACTRRRVSLDGTDGRPKVLSESGKDLHVYGDWSSTQIPTRAEDLVLVEGESDCWTLWFHKVAALGIPGASAANVLMSRHLDGVKTVHVWKEPDHGGETFMAGIVKRLTALGFDGAVRVLRHDAYKDPSDIHRAGVWDDVWPDVMKNAEVVSLPSTPAPRLSSPPSAPLTITDDDRAEPRFRYLWDGKHRRLTDDDRARRIRSLKDAYEYVPFGFFTDYLAWAAPATDAPVMFHVSGALTLAAHLLNRRVSLEFGPRRLYPQLWIANIAESTLFRKSTATGMAVGWLRDDPEYNKTLLSSSAFSMEGVYAQLGLKLDDQTTEDAARLLYENSEQQAKTTGVPLLAGVGLFAVDELGAWLSALDATYNKGGKKILTELLDYQGRSWVKRLAHGGYYIHRPHVNILAASTIDWVNTTATEEDRKGGFLPRWLLVCNWGQDYRLSVPDKHGPADPVKAHLDRLRTLEGNYVLSDEAEDFYHNWDQAFSRVEDERIGAWVNRLAIMALKIALIYAATDATATAVEVRHLRLAVKLIERCRDDLVRLLRWDLAFTPEERNRNKVMRILETEKVVPHARLLRNSHLSARDLKDVLNTLEEQDMIATDETKATKVGKVYRWVG